MIQGGQKSKQFDIVAALPVFVDSIGVFKAATHGQISGHLEPAYVHPHTVCVTPLTSIRIQEAEVRHLFGVVPVMVRFGAQSCVRPAFAVEDDD